MICNNPTLIIPSPLHFALHLFLFILTFFTSFTFPTFASSSTLFPPKSRIANTQFVQQLGCYLIVEIENRQSMHNPFIKSNKINKNDLYYGNTLALAKQKVQSYKIRDLAREPKMLISILSKQKTPNYAAQYAENSNFLKINGHQIASMNKYQNARRNSQSKNNARIRDILDESNQKIDKIISSGNKEKIFHQLKKMKSHDHKSYERFDYTKSYPNIMAEQQESISPERLGTTEQANLFPEISPKQITIINQKMSKPRQSERQNYSVIKYSKRRETVVDTTVHRQKQVISEQPNKNKQQAKKLANFLQYREFQMTICLTNRIIIQPEEEAQYKAYICKGNNGLLVKSIVKTRPWWSFKSIADIDSCHLVWTEWKRNKSINLLPVHQHKDQLKEQYTPHVLNIKSTNKQIRERTEKKYLNFSKIVGKNNIIFSKYDESMLNENYLTFTAKLSQKHFLQIPQKHLNKQEFELISKNGQKKLVNHIPGCLNLHSKKLLFLLMSKYYTKLGKDVFSVIPVTFLITKGITDPQFQKFSSYFEDINQKAKNSKTGTNVWILKPGENSNRGNGIQVVSSINQIKSIIGQKCSSNRTIIIQKYMQNPFLYNKRKFDIRCYILITCVGGVIKGYWYEEGYVRTTSKEYNLKNLQNKLIHLTNDAIQKKGEQYGKFEGFNKVSFADLQKYIESNTQVIFKTVYDKIKVLATDLVISVARKINPHHKQFTFQTFGLDFMLDDKLNPYLIEANSNPCLQVDGNVLAKVIPPMIENVIRVAIDPIFPPPFSQSTRSKFSPGSTFQTNKLVLVYDSLHQSPIQQIEDVDIIDKQCQQFQGDLDQQ